MSFKKLAPIVPAISALLVLSWCGGQDNLEEAGDPPEVTCERFQDVINEVSDIDPASMSFGDILGQVSDSFSEIETIADEAQDDKLGQSIDTMAEALNSSIASAGGDLETIESEFQARLDEPDVQEAAAYLDEVCGFQMPL